MSFGLKTHWQGARATAPRRQLKPMHNQQTAACMGAQLACQGCAGALGRKPAGARGTAATRGLLSSAAIKHAADRRPRAAAVSAWPRAVRWAGILELSWRCAVPLATGSGALAGRATPHQKLAGRLRQRRYAPWPLAPLEAPSDRHTHSCSCSLTNPCIGINAPGRAHDKLCANNSLLKPRSKPSAVPAAC